jgi:hypothetical protein
MKKVRRLIFGGAVERKRMDRSQITESKQVFLTEPALFVLIFCTCVHAPQ